MSKIEDQELNDLGDLENEQITYEEDSIVVTYREKIRRTCDSKQRISANYSTYWYMAKIIEQEIINRKKLTT